MKYGIYTLIVENYLTKHLSTIQNYPLIMEFGWGNGYILLPTNHPLYEVSYDDMNTISVHGGLTYGRFFDSDSFLNWTEGLEIDGDVTKENYKKFNNYWIVGFDTSHYGDNKENCTKKYVTMQTEEFIEQFLDSDIEGINKYKYRYSRKEKLENIDIVIKK